MVYHGIVLFWYIMENSGFSTIVLLLYIMGFTTMGLFYPRKNHKLVVNPSATSGFSNPIYARGQSSVIPNPTDMLRAGIP